MRRSGFRSLFFTAFLLLFVLFSAASPAYSATVTLQWDANNQTPDGYNLYSRLENESYDYEMPVWTGAGTSCTLTVPDQTGIYFVIRAYNGAEESNNSNEVYYISPSAFEDQNTEEWDNSEAVGHGEDSNSADDSGGGDMQSGSDTKPDTPENTGGPASSDGDDEPPVLIAPIMQNGVSLTPVLQIGTGNTAKTGTPSGTQWQISMDRDFSQLIFDITSERHLMMLMVPDLVLEPEAEYYWRARWIGPDGSAGDWSETGTFVTVAADQSEDQDSNGILDQQEINTHDVDLDGNGMPDVEQDDLMCIHTAVGNAMIGIKPATTGVSVVSVKSLGEDPLYDTENKPESMDMGIVSFKLFLQDEVDTVMVTIYFSEPAPDEAEWYKYHIEGGWQRFEAAIFSEDRRSITITFEDGGYGDDDGVKNGIIVDPSGLVFRSGDAQSHLAAHSNGNTLSALADGGCFISGMTPHGKPPIGMINMGALSIFMLLAVGVIRFGKQRMP